MGHAHARARTQTHTRARTHTHAPTAVMTTKQQNITCACYNKTPRLGCAQHSASTACLPSGCPAVDLVLAVFVVTLR